MENETMNGYTAQLQHSKDELPTSLDVRHQAKREKREVVARVLMPDDTIATVKAGPRGGFKILARM